MFLLSYLLRFRSWAVWVPRYRCDGFRLDVLPNSTVGLHRCRVGGRWSAASGRLFVMKGRIARMYWVCQGGLGWRGLGRRLRWRLEGGRFRDDVADHLGDACAGVAISCWPGNLALFRTRGGRKVHKEGLSPCSFVEG